MKNKKILLINTQFVELNISGFTNRFIGLWCYLQKNRAQTKHAHDVHWLTNRSLWNKYFKDQAPSSNITVISADLGFFKYSSRLFYPFYVLYIYYKHRCTSVHIATSIIKSLYLIRLFNFLRIPYCISFASNSIEMASYASDRMRNHWRKVFLLAKNVDVLNPTNSIELQGKKFVSPNSFPYITEINGIPVSKFTNANRKNVIIFCGSFVDQKNPLLAIEGFKQFLIAYSYLFPDSELWMFGKGNLLPLMTEQITIVNKKFQREAIRLLPEADLLDSLSVSKIFLSLQDYDNYPSQAVMEAMLFCNSVISINNGDTLRLIKPDKGNLLMDMKDPRKLAESINTLLQGWQLNQLNRQHILTDFSAEKFSEYFFQIHSSLN